MKKASIFLSVKIRRLLIIVLALFALSSTNAIAKADDASRSDLTTASLEQLLELEVITASKIARQVSDAPSAVSIVTAEDIKAYGYRTLAEILNSMRGLNITYDRAYDFMGGRGYSSPGDYSGRIMLLIDGVQVNDNVYNQSYFGNDGLIDTELIDRVEYVSGPGSVSYGNNAFFGIVNIFTKKGVDLDSTQAALSLGSYQTQKGRLSYGKRFDSGVDLLVSASGLNSKGQNFYFSEFDNGDPTHNRGLAQNLDRQNNLRLFTKVQGDFWSIETGYSQRHKDVPTAPYASDFNSPYSYEDTTKFISGQYHTNLSDHLKLSLQTDYSDYRFHQNSAFSGESWQETASGSRWGTEAKFVGSWFSHHKLVFGIAYRNDYQRKIVNPVLLADYGRQAISLYGQDEIALLNNLWLNVGARYDHFTDDGDSISPRVAIIYEPIPSYTLRLSHSIAHRTPTIFEKYYTDASTQFPNASLQMESVAATELILEHRWSNQTRLLASLYHQATEDSIASTPYDSGFIQYSNGKGGYTNGLELEFEHHSDNGLRLRTSYAYQDARNPDGNWTINSPHYLGKFNLSAPLYANALRTGLEIQAVSSRNNGLSRPISGYALANLTVSTDRLLPNLDVSLTVRNLLDKRYEHSAPEYNTPITTIEQDGRNVWLQLTYRLK